MSPSPDPSGPARRVSALQLAMRACASLRKGVSMTRFLGPELEILLVFSRSSRRKPVPWARAFSRHRHGSVHGCGQEGEGKRVSQSGGHSRGSQGRGSPGPGGVTSSQRCAKQVSGSGAWACGPRAAGGFARGRPRWPSGARFCRPQADRRGGTVTGQGTCRFREKAKGPGAGGWCREGRSVFSRSGVREPQPVPPAASCCVLRPCEQHHGA